MPRTAHHEQSLLAQLRALVPPRRLSVSEALAVAEAQARLIRRRLDGQPVTAESLRSILPCIRVVTLGDMPFSGSTHWTGRAWLIALNADEPEVRRRFSLAHEVKHLLDHPFDRQLYPRSSRGSDRLREQIADYFGGVLLMEKGHLTRLFCAGWSLEQLAAAFDVSPRAVEVRLNQLGLRDLPGPECHRTPVSRFLPPQLGVAA